MNAQNHQAHESHAATRGTSLLETIVALAILTVTALSLAAMIGASQRLGNLTRERAVASGAVRSYVETMRAKDIVAILSDGSTPADFLTGSPSLTDARGEVFKIASEDATTGWRITGTTGSSNTNTAAVAFPSAERPALRFPRDLDADGDASGGSIGGASLAVLPCRVKLTWSAQMAGATTQTAVMYVIFSDP